ncbi:MAG: hypothetical protein LIO79_05575 [Rikenellaceae bacterium]|nr:hypothetical protein [Rikenellaceae bacterium]
MSISLKNFTLKAIIAYIYIVLFSGWLMARIHLPESLWAILQPVIDMIPLLLFIFNFRILKSNIFFVHTTKFWRLLIVFVTIAIFSTIIQSAGIASTVVHLGIMFRFLPLAIFFAQSGDADNNNAIFIKHFKIITSILIVIGFIQLVGGIRVFEFFKPLTKERSSISIADAEHLDGMVYGIFPNSIDFSFFLVIAYAFFINQNNLTSFKKFFLNIIFLILIYYTGSKAALFMYILIFSISLKNSGIRISFWFIGILAGAVTAYIYWDLLYWLLFIDAKFSRLGMIIYTLPEFISKMNFATFFGAGSDGDIIFKLVNDLPNTPAMLKQRESMASFEDCSYVALTVYYGLVGIGLLITLYYKLYNTLMSLKFRDNVMNYKKIIISIYICVIIGPLFSQITITRPFSLFFWILIGFIYSKRKNNQAIPNF